MRIATIGLSIATAALLLGGCARNNVASRGRPDEFAVVRNQPLIIPPDYALAPPRAGDPTPQAADARTQALDALFGGPAPRSQSETSLLNAAGSERAALGARSVAGDPNTQVVDKGAVTAAIINAPAAAGSVATASTPQ